MNKSPVVIFPYKKRGNLKKIFELINQYNPPTVYIVFDQAANQGIKKLQKEIGSFIEKFEFSSKKVIIRPPSNKGVTKVYDFGLDFVFEKEEQVIILEDDTIPTLHFFDYCDVMLKKFKHDESVGCINGCNLEASMLFSGYFFSTMCMPYWGWATWRDRWSRLPKDYSFWVSYRSVYPKEKNDLLNQFAAIFDRSVLDDKAWDIRWTMFLLSTSMKAVLPGGNLVTNVGFTDEATFTNISDSKFSSLQVVEDWKDRKIAGTEIVKEEEYLLKIKQLMNDIAKRI